ncbi:hypothetical protein [Acidithiobacillus thiooxidans]|uniref:hypothetical protein n=1 Tax=Acidithiobacillus thiooxidans TaxID=930 RepID=UPI0004E281EB|nr:hypothetical protein [Acidithiobacillus thiooxidans]
MQDGNGKLGAGLAEERAYLRWPPSTQWTIRPEWAGTALGSGRQRPAKGDLGASVTGGGEGSGLEKDGQAGLARRSVDLLEVDPD